MIDTRLTIRPLPASTGRGPFLSPERWVTDAHPPLVDAGYEVREYLVSGVSDVYIPQLTAGDPRGEYTTRALVVRPSSVEAFSGVVHLELLNPSTGEDFPMFWPDAGFHLMDRGDVYVGVTCKAVSASSLRDRDLERYADLRIRHDSVVWDMLGSIAAALRAPDGNGLLDGLGRIRRLFATGWSQSGSFLRTYIAEGLHMEHSRSASPTENVAIIDGYLIGVSSGGFGPMGYVELSRDGEIEFDESLKPATLNPGQIPVHDPRRTVAGSTVPVIEYMSQDEAAHHIWNLRPDSDDPNDLYRGYQIPGRGHETGLLQTADREPEAASYGDPAPAWPDPPRHESSRWLIAAAVEHLVAWAEGVTPPRAEPIRFAVNASEPLDPRGLDFGYVSIPTDDAGHALGGVRHLEVDLPTHHWTWVALGASVGREWSATPFTAAELQERYGGAAEYQRRVRERASQLVTAGWILPQHLERAITDATERFESAMAADKSTPAAAEVGA